MGVMRFLVHPPERLAAWPEAHRAYITGFDRHVFPTRVEIHGNVMTCRRPHSDSGKLHVVYPVEGFGRPVLTTASLPENDQPYLLALELARGRISELRDQSAAWEMAKMTIPPEFQRAHRDAFHLFSQATAAKADTVRSSELADDAIRQACRASALLISSYTQQRMAVIQRSALHPPASLGCSLAWGEVDGDALSEFSQTFHAANVPLEWRFVEPQEGDYRWEIADQLIDRCRDNRLLIRGGPLINLASQGLPGWLQQWENDILNLQSFVSDFVETVIARYLGRIRLWEISAYGNSGGALALSEENRLGLVARTLEVASRTDDDAQFFLRVDQPWGDYQARGQHRLSPYQFVDAIVRSNLGLSGVNLEISVGYRPQGCASRDLLTVSRLIDYWSLLGIQIHVTLAFPSADTPDPLADQELEVDAPACGTNWSEQAQADWIGAFVPLLMAKPAVTGVYWSHFSDAVPHRFPHAGLLDATGRPKAALGTFQRLHHFTRD